MRAHCTLIRMAKLQNTDTFTSGEAVEQPQELGSIAGENATRYSHRGRQLAVSYKTKLLLAYDPAITILSLYPTKLNVHVHTKTCTQMFKAALLITVKTWANKICFSRWMDPPWHLRTMEHDSALNRNELSGGTVNTYHYGKGTNLQRLRTRWIQLCGILEKARL